MNNAEFDIVIKRAVEALPAEFRSALDNISLFVEDYPDAEALLDTGAPDLLGLYQGVPLPQRTSGYGGGFYTMTLPDRITLYKKSIERYCREEQADLKDQITLTLLHEIGHYMGLSEGELREIERSIEEKKNRASSQGTKS